MNIKLVSALSISFTAALVWASGCIGNPDPPYLGAGGAGGAGGSIGLGGAGGVGETSAATGANDSDARKFFVTDVYPLLLSTDDVMHSCTVCHATGANDAPTYMGMDPESTYDKMDAYTGLIVAPPDSQLLLHGLHTGPALTQVQRDTVTHWLTMEALERGLSPDGGASSGGSTGMTLEELLDQVGKCMDSNDWKNNKLDQFSQNQTLTDGPCGGCHSLGEGGNYLDTLHPDTTFSMQKVRPYVKRWFKANYVGGQVTGLAPNPRLYQKGDELSQKPCTPAPGTICHPTFVINSTFKKGIDNFIASTLTRMANNACAP